MNIVTANLKHLYQKKIVYVYFIPLILVGLSVLFTLGHDKKLEIAFNLVVMWCGICSALQNLLGVDMMTLPITFCLPGHHNVPRKLAFICGAVVSLFWSLTFLRHPEMSLFSLSTAALFSLLFAVYTITAWLCLRFGVYFFTLPFAFIFIPIMVGSYFYPLYHIPYAAVIHYPVWTILIGALIVWKVWRRLADGRWYHRLHENLVFTARISDILKGETSQPKINRTQKASSLRILFIESCLLNKITSAPADSVSKYVWGALYGPLTAKNDLKIIIFLLLFCLTGVGAFSYCVDNHFSWIVFWFIMGTNPSLSDRMYSSHLFVGGRRERFWATGVLTAAVCGVYSLLALTAIYYTRFLGEVLPTVWGQSCQPIPMLFAVLPWFVFPVAETLYMRLSRRMDIRFFRLVILFVMIFAAIPFVIANQSLSPTVIAIVLLVSWTLYTHTLWTTAHRACLV